MYDNVHSKGVVYTFPYIWCQYLSTFLHRVRVMIYNEKFIKQTAYRWPREGDYWKEFRHHSRQKFLLFVYHRVQSIRPHCKINISVRLFIFQAMGQTFVTLDTTTLQKSMHTVTVTTILYLQVQALLVTNLKNEFS